MSGLARLIDKPAGRERDLSPTMTRLEAPVTEDQIVRLISLAESAAERSEWLQSLDYASQALTADPRRTAAAELVGNARARLSAVRAVGPELRQITVVAVDMHGSTSIAAAAGAERMRELMLELYEVCIEGVTRYDGRVSKYLGDGVLAQFGYPIVHDDDARRSVHASLAILAAVEARAEDWEARFGERISIRIGVDSGVAAVGPMDSSPWSGEELAGDPPNIASRVQSTAERMTVRVTDATNELIKGWFDTLPVGPVELRNYPRPIGLHRVLGPTQAETRLEARGGTRPPLVGRDGELAELRAAWNRVATNGERRIVNLTGEPGIGKSRLAEHVIATAVATGATNVTLACSRLHRDSSLRPVARALGRFFRFSAKERDNDALSLDAIRRQLEQLGNRRMPTEEAVPVYGWLLGIRSAVDLEPELLRRQSFHAVIDLLEALAATSGLVLGVDDADTADPSTVELLQRLLARPASPILMVLTSRVAFTGLADGEVLELAGLASEGAAALVRAVAPTLDDEAVGRILATSDGVPYLLEEQARAAQEGSGRATAEPLELSVFLAARLDELGADMRRLLGLIAAAGTSIRVDVLRRLTDADAAELDERLQELGSRRVLLRASGPRGDVVRFRHGLMREAAYDGLLLAKRSELHRRIATYMSELPPGSVPPEDLARHYTRAGAAVEAAHWWGEAGRAAAAGGANAEAVELFERSLEALGQLPEGGGQEGLELALQLGLGTARSTMDGYTSPQARKSFERAVVLGDGLADTTALFPALWGTWSYWFVLGEVGLASGLADRCLRIAREADDERLRFEAGAIVGYQRLHLGDFEGARSELQLAGKQVGLEPVTAFPHDPGIVSLSALAVALWFLGETEASRSTASEALSLAESLDANDRRAGLTEAWVRCNFAWRAELDGDHAGAIEMAERAAEIATDRGYATWLAAASLHRSIGVCSQGDLERGLPTLAKLVDAWRSAGCDDEGRQRHPVLMTPYFAGRLAEARLASGDIEEASAQIDEILAATATSGECFWDAELLRLRASARAGGAAGGRAS